MISEFIKNQNEEDDLFINPNNNNNLEFLTNFIKLELEFFNYRRMCEVDIAEDDTFLRNTLPSAYASNTSVMERAKKQYELLVEKYKGMPLNLNSLEELNRNIHKKMRCNEEKRKQLYNSHFLRDERKGIMTEDINKINKMINLCIDHNIEMEGINLIKFRSLRNTIYRGCYLSQINVKEFEEC